MAGGEIRYIADSMLGKLARWLRVMGFDTHYQPFYRQKVFEHFISKGYLLLSCQESKITKYSNSMLIRSNNIQEQLKEIKDKGFLLEDKSKLFTRCLRCNLVLEKVSVEDARENIPEYVFYQNITQVKTCRSCGRFFWPGNHRNNMITQLNRWGFYID